MIDGLADDPRAGALLKMGAIHLGRGSTFLNTFDFGSRLEGVAAIHGRTVLRVAVMPLAGRQTRIQPSADGMFSTVDFRSELVAGLLTASGIDEDAVAESGWSLVPLAPIALQLEQDGLDALTREQRFFLLGYDALITTRGGREATALAR